MDKISIIVIEDHPIFRQGVVDTLSLEPDLLVVEAATGEEGLRLMRILRPQVAIVDVNLPGINGQQVARQAALDKIPARVILLTAYDDEEQKIHAMRHGSAAYCTKDVQPQKLVEIIRAVAGGAYVLGEEIMELPDLLKWLQEKTRAASKPYSDPGEPYQPLSSREMEVLSLLTQGKSNKEIAAALGISHQTVKNHVTAIFRKLGVEDRTQATVYALKRGWVRL